MALTKANADAVRTSWKRKVYHVRKNQSRFGRFEGASEQMPIMEVREGLNDARSMNYTLVRKLTSRGRGIATMVGNEEQLKNATSSIYPTWLQNATVVRIDDAHESSFDLYAEQRPSLNEWLSDMDTTRQIEAMFSLGNDTALWEADGSRNTSRTVPFWSATATHKSNWMADNQTDRVLFGDDFANVVTGDFDASIAGITAAMTMDSTILQLLVDQAEKTDWENGVHPIHPYRQDGIDEERYVVAHSPASFRQLQADPVVQRFHQEAVKSLGDKNPYFGGGAIFFEKTINVRAPELTPYLDANLVDAGAANANLTGAALMGRQAICKGIGKNAKPTRRKEDDYEQFKGVGIRAMDTYEKTFYKAAQSDTTMGKQYGVINWFGSAAAA